METYEEKYKDLVKRLNKAREEKGVYTFNSVLDIVAPELKIDESEDERIRKAIKLMYSFLQNEPTYIGDVPVKDIFAWLEKQGEQKPTIEMKTPEESLGIDSDTYNKIVDECIYGEQKPADKVEPKFKNGDWVKAISSGNIFKILSVNDGLYRVLCYDGVEANYPIEVEKDLAYWTIQDAKKGDILSDGTIVLIVDSIGEFEGKPIINSWYFADSKKFYGKGTSDCDKWEIDSFRTATKAECNYLLKMMADAGYTFDFEKKELKKIEKKHAWSEEDGEIINNIGEYLNRYGNYIADKNEEKAAKIYKSADWLKSLKERYTWKPSDEQMLAINTAINVLGKGTLTGKYLIELHEQLKKLREE